MVITADQARTLHVEGASPDTLATEKMIERTDKIIRACSAQGIRNARLVVPLWLVGVPVYDRNTVKQEVMSVFRANGFEVFDDGEDEDEGSFGVSWEPKVPPKDSDKKHNQKVSTSNEIPLQESTLDESDEISSQMIRLKF